MSTKDPNRFYVYEHWRLDTNQCFYVGKGQGKRAWKRGDRNKAHLALLDALTQSGVNIRIVVDRLEENAAFELEKYLISFWREQGVPLVNTTEGGRGSSGAIVTFETRRKLSAAHKGKKHSAEHRAKVSIARKGNKHGLGKKWSKESRAAHSVRCTGRKMSAEAKQNMRLAKLGKKRSPEACKNLSEKHLARLSDPETREQVTNRLKPYWHLPPNSRSQVKAS